MSTMQMCFDAIDIDATGYLMDYYQPLNLTAIPGDSTINLTWDSADGATSYNIKRSESLGGPYVTVASGSSICYYSDTNVTNGTTYYYVISAVLSTHESSNSAEASAVPTATAITGNAILEVYMDNGTVKEFNLTGSELNDFLTWYDNRSIGTGKSYYIFTVKGSVSPYTNIKNYIPFNKILYFNVKSYNE